MNICSSFYGLLVAVIIGKKLQSNSRAGSYSIIIKMLLILRSRCNQLRFVTGS